METVKQPSEMDKLYTKFLSLNDSLRGENNIERLSSFISAQFSEDEVNSKKEVLNSLREKVQYYQDLEEITKLSIDKKRQVELALQFCVRYNEFNNDPKLFLESIFNQYSSKIKEGYCYKDFIDKTSRMCETMLQNNKLGSGIEYLG